MNLLLIIVAVLFPPLAVLVKRGVGKDLFPDTRLWVLMWGWKGYWE